MQDIIKEITGDFFRRHLEDLFEKKLTSNGMAPSVALISALVSHATTNIEGPFIWEGQELEFEFSDEEISSIESAADAFSEGLPSVVDAAVRIRADMALEDLQLRWPEHYAWEKHERDGFRFRLEMRWTEALTALRMLARMSSELGAERLQVERAAQTDVDRFKTEALLRLHVRACQVTSEIIHLMEGGYPDGAMARWRTLHEIRVIAELLWKNGDEVSERYLAHDSVETRRESLVYQRSYVLLGYEPPHAKEVERVEASFAEALKTYGQEFKEEYGWAAKLLGKAKPTFADLETGAGLERMRSHYKIASYNVHAGIKGLTFKHGAMQDEETMIAGASNSGLEEPGQNTAIALTHITLAILPPRSPTEEVILLTTLFDLQERTIKAFIGISNQLRKEDQAEDAEHPGTSSR